MATHKSKYGFIYLWYDRKHKRYYVGCHWGQEDDGYVCSSEWMSRSYARRPKDFKRRILKRNIQSRFEMYEEELRWLKMIKKSEIKPLNPKPRYYNLRVTVNEHWLKHVETRKKVGAKISAAKKGKIIGPCPPERAAKISAAKKASFEKRLAETGEKTSPEWRQKNSDAKKGIKQSAESHAKRSESLKRAYAEGRRKRAEPKIVMTREQQDAQTSTRLKSLWSNPEWAARQRARLKEGSARRYGKPI